MGAIMGISGLTRVIADHAPAAIKHNEIKAYGGRKVALDASMAIYQFLIAVRSEGQVLQNEAGETTSHLMGMFFRTIRMIDNGIKPVYVFDGKPPQLKSGELAKRLERRDAAHQALATATEAGDREAMDKFSKRTVKVTREHNEDCQTLLRLMGVPYVEAPCEAEAQCAALCRAGKVYAVGSEDMDTLTFGAPVLLRHLTFSEARKMPIDEYHLDRVLAGLGTSMDEFRDLCILLGCDYCDSIQGVGPKRAYTLIKEHGSIEKVLEQMGDKLKVKSDWEYVEARRLFTEPDVTDPEAIQLTWTEPDEEGVVDFLVRRKGFNENRVRDNMAKLRAKLKASEQSRLDSFFKAAPRANTTAAGAKRKADEDKSGANKGKTAAAATKKSKLTGKGKR